MLDHPTTNVAVRDDIKKGEARRVMEEEMNLAHVAPSECDDVTWVGSDPADETDVSADASQLPDGWGIVGVHAVAGTLYVEVGRQ